MQNDAEALAVVARKLQRQVLGQRIAQRGRMSQALALGNLNRGQRHRRFPQQCHSQRHGSDRASALFAADGAAPPDDIAQCFARAAHATLISVNNPDSAAVPWAAYPRNRLGLWCRSGAQGRRRGRPVVTVEIDPLTLFARRNLERAGYCA